MAVGWEAFDSFVVCRVWFEICFDFFYLCCSVLYYFQFWILILVYARREVLADEKDGISKSDDICSYKLWITVSAVASLSWHGVKVYAFYWFFGWLVFKCGPILFLDVLFNSFIYLECVRYYCDFLFYKKNIKFIHLKILHFYFYYLLKKTFLK